MSKRKHTELESDILEKKRNVEHETKQKTIQLDKALFIPFALYPISYTPSGHINMGRIRENATPMPIVLPVYQNSSRYKQSKKRKHNSDKKE